MRAMRTSPTLVGRDADTRLLAAAYDDIGGDGVVVVGPAGVGKTRLVEEFIDLREAAGTPVIRVSATRGLSTVALGAFVDSLGDVVAANLADTASVVAGVTGSLPEAHGVGRSLISVDDLQLLDDLSASVVGLLAARPDTFVVGTLRSGEPIPEDVSRFLTEPRVARHELAPLLDNETVELAESLLEGTLADETAAELCRLAAGNPLFTIELIRGGVASGALEDIGRSNWVARSVLSDSQRILDTVGRRLLTLDALSKDTCAAVAMSEPIPLEVVLSIVPGAPVEELEEMALLRSETPPHGNTTVRFTHPLYGELAGSDLLPGFAARRHRLLRPMAAALANNHDPDVVLRCAELVASAQVAEDGDAEVLARAAAMARARMDLRAARRLARTALERMQTRDLGVACLLAGCETVLDGDESRFVTLFEEAADAGEMAVVTAAHVYMLALEVERPTDGLDLLARRRRQPSLSNDRSLAGLHASMQFFFEGSAAALATARENISQGVEVDDFSAISVLAAGACAALVEGLPELSAQWSKQGLRLYDSLDDSVGGSELAHARDQLVTCHYLYGVQVGRMDQSPDRVLEEYGALRPTDPLDALMIPGFVALWRGHLDRAQELFDEGAEMLEMTALNRRTFSYTNRATLAFLRGEVDAGWNWLDRTRRIPGAVAGFAWMVERAEVLGLVAEGRITEAIALARSVAASPKCGAWGKTTLLHDLVRVGCATERDSQELEELATRSGSTWLDRICHMHAVARRSGDGVTLESVSAAFEEGGLDLLAAETAAQAANAHRGAGSTIASARCAGSVQRLLDEVGAARTPALEEVDDVFDPLTARERLVARLAADGLTNKEIAGRLVVSVRTVANQLQAVYAKMDIHSRHDLARLFDAGTNRSG